MQLWRPVSPSSSKRFLNFLVILSDQLRNYFSEWSDLCYNEFWWSIHCSKGHNVIIIIIIIINTNNNNNVTLLNDSVVPLWLTYQCSNFLTVVSLDASFSRTVGQPKRRSLKWRMSCIACMARLKLRKPEPHSIHCDRFTVPVLFRRPTGGLNTDSDPEAQERTGITADSWSQTRFRPTSPRTNRDSDRRLALTRRNPKITSFQPRSFAICVDERWPFQSVGC